MNIIHMAFPVFLVAQRMFPVTALPDAALTLQFLLEERGPQLGTLRENPSLMRRHRSG